MRSTTPRWGTGSFLVAWIGGLVAGVVAASVVYEIAGTDAGEEHLGAMVTAFVVQSLVSVLLVTWASASRGTASLRRDFGLGLAWRDWWWLLAGAGAQIVVVFTLLPLTLLAPDQSQGVVESFQDAAGDPLVVVFAVCVVVLAPLAEELLFRGVLLRRLLRSTTPGVAVLVSASVFAAVHLLLDPSVGSALVLPGLLFLGLLAGDRAVRTGSLSQPILLHAGFNLLTAVSILAL